MHNKYKGLYGNLTPKIVGSSSAPVHPFTKQRACHRLYILQSKPNAFLTFLLSSPSSLCKLPNKHPSRICKSGEASFKPLGQCVQ